MSAALEDRPVCRRCKKKRPIDEPLETARYRTCKPCREIERKKKRLKKLEMTGREAAQSGIHQGDVSKPAYQVDQNIINLANQVTRATQLPPQNQQFDHLNPPVLAPINYQQQSQHEVQQRILQHQQAQQQQAQQQAQAAAQAAAQAQQAISNQKVEEREIPIDELLLKQDGQSVHESEQHDSKILTQEALDAIAQTQHHDEDLANKTTESEENNNLFAALKNAEANEHAHSVGNDVEDLDNASSDELKDEESNVCIYCGATRDIHDNGRYQLCGSCVENPLDTDNVFDDFNSYLERVGLGKVADLKNIIFIKRFEENEYISDLKQYQDDSNNLEEIIEELNQKFINPIIEVSGFKFSKSSSNFSTKPLPKSIKLLYKCKQDIKTLQRANVQNPNIGINNGRLKTEDCKSNIYLSYDIFTKDLTIKFNHKTHKPFLEKKYSQGLIDKVKDLAQGQNDLNDIFENLQNLESDLKDEIRELKKANFVKDFSNF
jgi:type II secretory pathway pseudopilin PulG